MIFLTVGSTNIPFDRLFSTIDRAISNGVIKDEVFGQIGCSTYTPKNFDYKRYINKHEFDEMFDKSDLVIGHAGMGTIMMSLDMDKPLLVAPRRKKYNEHVNEHQYHTANRFEELNHVVVIYDMDDDEELKRKIDEAMIFVPVPRVPKGDELAQHIVEFIQVMD